MIDLNKDMFVHLSISAHNIRLHGMPKDMHTLRKPRVPVPEKKQKFFKALLDEGLADDKSIGMKPVLVVQNDYETIQDVKYRKELESLRSELSNLESVFKDLQHKEANIELLLKVHAKIVALKQTIEEKCH